MITADVSLGLFENSSIYLRGSGDLKKLFMTQSDIQLFLESLIVILGFYLAFYKSYFKEKGKNVATKEDIEEITKKIEKVKSDVEILTHKKISLSNEKQNTLMDYNNKYASWLNYILNASIIGDSNPASIFTEKVQERLDQLFNEVAISEAKFNVYFHSDQELIDLKNSIQLKTIELSNHFNISLVKAKKISNILNNVLNLPNSVPDNSYKMNQLDKHYSEQNNMHKEFQDQKLAMYSTIAPLNYQFVQLISKRIHDL